ncbi:coiled-coil domain-containing protein AGAP005037 isoform X1 [Papilio machaon]|uniref:coiled-coil domain-containing protein AGAP005037 isoform X1 n=1 Tax=Papilio machaon TaxID=76193 RepID=UPI001E665FDB|nr:coiled-coil domain-containing protein AGAP005037 isoform X1 [Papilio machaon]
MNDNSKKRSNSFRKLFPNLFFTHRSKDKNTNKEYGTGHKNVAELQANKNQYQNPRTLVDKNTFIQDSDVTQERIYENLSASHRSGNDRIVDLSSNHSSSSTLVSDNVKKQIDFSDQPKNENYYTTYMARPQVPPKPQGEIIQSTSPRPQKLNDFNTIQYPDVYYHSLEKLIDKITPLDEIEIYKASQAQANPASVGAEIKRVSTKFLISPKKEAEVRTIQPTRARSLSLDKNNSHNIPNQNDDLARNHDYVKKPYNYSAPTSPVAATQKRPNIPKTVSPYGHVRKTMLETEEKRNSISRASLGNKSTPSPRPQHLDITIPTSPRNNNGDNDKEKTRQKIEAFYWQKLKELKEKEDEQLLKQSLDNIRISPQKFNTVYSSSNCSTPSSFVTEPKSYSLPRGRDLNYNMAQPIYALPPFVRGAPERRTDSFIRNHTSDADTDIVYRQMRKSSSRTTSPVVNRQMPIFQRGSLTPDGRHNIYQPKRVSFEEQYAKTSLSNNSEIPKSVALDVKLSNDSYKILSARNALFPGKINSSVTQDYGTPPKPPVRTTSVDSVGKTYKIINKNTAYLVRGNHSVYSESESGSEAGEIQKILQRPSHNEEDWHVDGSRMDGGLSDGEAGRVPPRGRPSRREDPRRHTLAGNHLYLHPHHPNQINSLELERNAPVTTAKNMPEYATVTKYRDVNQKMLDPRMRKHPLQRNYPPTNNALLFEDDPGVMSEVETASTGFRRGGKQRSSLPVVRTPSKTLERPLGLVFLQYRNETKRALLPNEITSIDTVKALFVRSFPKQLTMQYMESPMVKIYIHDSSKDMFYELEDVRSHLHDIRDRSVLRLFESNDIGGGVFPGAVGVGSVSMPAAATTCPTTSNWDQEQSYFSEPEIDSEYHHHVHKSKVKAPAYYMGTQAPSTLPRGGAIIRAFSPAAPPVPADRVKPITTNVPTKPLRYAPGTGSERCFPFADCPRVTEQLYTITGDGYVSSPERSASRPPYEDPYYTQFLGQAARTNITPLIDEEASDSVIIDDSYQLYGVNAITTAPRPMPRPPFDARLTTQVDDMQRLRVEKMERQLANLTGLVQKALQVPGATPAPAAAPRQEFQTYQPRPATTDPVRFTSEERPPKLGRDRFQKSVSFEKSVSFSDDPPDMNSPKQHSPQHSADTKPAKPAIKSSTLPRTSSQERDRLKPAPPPKPAGLVSQQLPLAPQRTYTLNVGPDFFNQLRMLQKQSHDLRIETRNLRRSTLSQAIQMRQLMADTIVKIGAIAASYCEHDPDSQLSREEEIYRQDMLLLENDLYELEATVERLRGQAANRETRVNMADIERIAMVLSKSSKTVADWKLKFPILQDTMKVKLASEMEKVVRKEKMLEDEPERLELALRRCKKLTGTLVTLKRLACVQEQRLPITDGRTSSGSSQSSSLTAGPSSEEFTPESTCHLATSHNKGTGGVIPIRTTTNRGTTDVRPENALDALLDELQTFAKPSERAARTEGPLRRLHSYPSGSDTDASPPVRARGQHPPKPPVPERHPELLALAARRAPPPPPPRTTSRSPLASPTSPSSPRADSDSCRSNHESNYDEKGNSRQAVLEQRHQELLKKQKALQEQYARLQMIHRSGPTMPPNVQLELKKTGSESNLLTKMNLNLAPATISGSMTHLAADSERKRNEISDTEVLSPQSNKTPDAMPTTNKVYETDIL